MNTPKKILILENDIKTAKTLRDGLLAAFPDVRVIFDVSAAADEIRSFCPDAVIADGEIAPAKSISAFCRELNALSPAPLFLFAARAHSAERVRALNAGADIFWERIPDTRELTAQILAVWRRYLTPPPADGQKKALPRQIEYPGLFISLSNYSVFCEGNSVEMPPKELELLYFLAKSPNQVFTREQLLDHVWGYDYLGDARTVDVHIKRIREKLAGRGAWSLDTVWGVGYCFRVISSDSASDVPSVPSAQTDSV